MTDLLQSSRGPMHKIASNTDFSIINLKIEEVPVFVKIYNLYSFQLQKVLKIK